METSSKQRQQSTTGGEGRNVYYFSEMEFYEQFRFRKDEFWKVLWLMRWLEPNGQPKVYKIGVPGHRMSM